MDRIAEYLKYHADSSRAMDIDIQVEAVAFLCQRFRLDREQRLWLSFLFASTYCMATAWSVFRRVPSFDAMPPAAQERWWRSERQGLLFQTDRAWIRRNNQFCAVVASYRAFVERCAPKTHRQFDAVLAVTRDGKTPEERYERLVADTHISKFGRFAMFLYSELLYHAGLDVRPVLRLAEARSVRNGVVFAMGLEKTAYTRRHGRKATPEELVTLTDGLNRIVAAVQKQDILARHRSLWSIETTLCAYKKWHLGKRYVGYYVERTIREVVKMQSLHPVFDFASLVDFAKHYYPEQTRRIAHV